ncbi:MAG: zinc-dependent alcohol dehydrogenase [Christensenellaceae bacterium]|jgi:L-iditol 2-dehydrogenase
MKETMKAVVMHGPGEFGVEHVPVPQPAENEVLVKIKAVSICGSDPKLFSGGYTGIGWPPSFPFIPGHEFSGEVVETGPGVTGFSVGDRVAGEAHCGCGHCANCADGNYNLCLNYGKTNEGHRHYGFTYQGAYAEYNAYNVHALAKVPNNVSFEEASLTDTAGTALQAVNLTGITPGGYTLVIGPGPIGIFAMQIAKARGAKTIMVGRRDRLKIAQQMGADHTINYEECGDIVAKVKEITGGMGAHEAFECAGSDAAIKQSVLSLRKNGKVAFVALPTVDDHMVPTKTLVMNQITIYGSRANPNCSCEVLGMMEQGKISAKGMITHEFPIEEIRKAIDIFENRLDGAMKVIVKP